MVRVETLLNALYEVLTTSMPRRENRDIYEVSVAEGSAHMSSPSKKSYIL